MMFIKDIEKMIEQWVKEGKSDIWIQAHLTTLDVKIDKHRKKQQKNLNE